MLIAVGAMAPLTYAYHEKSEPSDGTVMSLRAVDPPRPVPDFVLENGTDRRVSLSDFKGRVVVLNLWATWCPPCIRELPALERLQRSFPESSLTVIALSVDRSGYAISNSFFDKLGIEDLTLLADPEQRVGAFFPVDVLPATFILNRDLHVISYLRSYAAWDAPEALALFQYLVDQ